jgi:hypothetical protein
LRSPFHWAFLSGGALAAGPQGGKFLDFLFNSLKLLSVEFEGRGNAMADPVNRDTIQGIKDLLQPLKEDYIDNTCNSMIGMADNWADEPRRSQIWQAWGGRAGKTRAQHLVDNLEHRIDEILHRFD